MPLEYGTTPGGNLFPLETSSYDQSQFWHDVAVAKDAKDVQLLGQAASLVLSDPKVMTHVGALPNGTNFDELTQTQVFRTSASWRYIGLPEGFGIAGDPNVACVGLVIGAGDGFKWGAQILFRQGDNPAFIWRVSSGATNNFANPWQTVGSGGGGELPDSFINAVGAGNEMRKQAMRDYYGNINTGGKGAVTWRFDHYLAAFNTNIRPRLEAKGLKYLLALDSRRWDHSQNAGITKAMVNSWVQSGGAEIWCHGTDHNDKTGLADLFDFFVTSKKELETDLPAAKIWGFIVPGPARLDPNVPAYDGFGTGNSIDSFINTVAGNLLLKTYAVTSGAMPGTSQRKMDGTIRQGLYHYGIEERTASEIIAQVDQAIANKTCLQLMMHPWMLDTAGKITTADLQTVIDYVSTKISEGKLANLSPYESLVATV